MAATAVAWLEPAFTWTWMGSEVSFDAVVVAQAVRNRIENRNVYLTRMAALFFLLIICQMIVTSRFKLGNHSSRWNAIRTSPNLTTGIFPDSIQRYMDLGLTRAYLAT